MSIPDTICDNNRVEGGNLERVGESLVAGTFAIKSDGEIDTAEPRRLPNPEVIDIWKADIFDTSGAILGTKYVAGKYGLTEDQIRSLWAGRPYRVELELVQANTWLIEKE